MLMTLAQTLLTRDLHCELKAHLRRPTLLPTQGLGEPLLGGEFSGFLILPTLHWTADAIPSVSLLFHLDPSILQGPARNG